jgi:hypothetical protein
LFEKGGGVKEVYGRKALSLINGLTALDPAYAEPSLTMRETWGNY